MTRFHSPRSFIIAFIIVSVVAAIGVNIQLDKDEALTTQTALAGTANPERASRSAGDFDSDFKQLQAANRAFIEVVNRAKSAVVQITTTKLIKQRGTRDPFEYFFNDDFFEYWFSPFERRERRRQPEEEPEEREVPGALGSGVIVSDDGYILTNDHVIEGADEIKVILPDGREFDAELIGKDAGRGGADLAVLKIDGEDLPTLSFGDSDQLSVGEWVIAIGSPFGLDQTVTRGIVSAKGRSSADVVSLASLIQTDAPINRGNSGGALINIHGELVGINTAIHTGGNFVQGNVGIGFAVPSNIARKVMTDLIEKGEVERGWLGITMQPIDQDLADKLELGKPRGALVADVGEDSPAQKAGIKRGDVIVAFDGIEIRDWNHLRDVVVSTEAGKTVDVKVIRKGSEKMLKVKLAKRTPEAVAALSGESAEPYAPEGEESSEAFAGLRVQNLTDELAQRYGHQSEKGVIVVEVDPRSSAARVGIRPGDLIQEIEWEPIGGLSDYKRLIKEAKDKETIVLYVKSPNGRRRYVTLEER